MPKQKPSGHIRRVYEFIEANEHKHNVRMMCRLLKVAPSGYYAWRKNPISDRALEGERLLCLIRASFEASHGIYGSLRVFLDLREAGETCSKHRVARLMRVNKIRARPGYKSRSHVAGKPAAAIPNLVQRNFNVEHPNRVWVRRYPALSSVLIRARGLIIPLWQRAAVHRRRSSARRVLSSVFPRCIPSPMHGSPPVHG